MTLDKDHIHAVKKGAANNKALPTLIQQIKDNSLSILMSNLDALFTSCDDLFFDLSSRAVNNNEQNLYFESMRELRIKKNGIITQFRHLLEQHFNNCLTTEEKEEPLSSTATNTNDTLSLVQDDEIEQSVAISSMASKARVNNQEALFQLCTRFSHLFAGKVITQNNNPLDPQQLCNSFAEACNLLDINIKAKIILFKQFDRLVINKVAKLYSNANDLLINAGVIPTISRTTVNPEHKRTKPLAEDFSNIDTDDEFQSSPVSLDDLTQLLATVRSVGLHNLPNYQAYSHNPGTILNNEDLIAAISILQQELLNTGSLLTTNSIHELVENILTQDNPDEPHAVKQTDEDVINLVAMFFDFVLDDRNLPSAIQALIGRLQIPILKIALKDKTFFNNSNHPARKLVNKLSELCIGLEDSNDLKQDKTYILVANIVKSLTESPNDDLSIFTTKLSELEAFSKKNKHRSDLIEKRTNQAASGKAKTDEAKFKTQKLLLEKLKNVPLPEPVSQFLVGEWQQLLVITHLRHGEDSTDWMHATQLVEDLVWACQPQTDEKSKLRLARIKQQVIERIEHGLATISINSEQVKEIRSTISKTIENAQGNSSDSADNKPLSMEQAIALGHTPGVGSKSWKDMSAIERQEARYKKLTYESIKKAEELPINTWLSYEDYSEGRSIRCKLSAKIEESDSYIFVNRFGFKTLEKSRKDFAYDIQKNRVKILDAEPLFDRTLSKIFGNLKQSADSTS